MSIRATRLGSLSSFTLGPQSGRTGTGTAFQIRLEGGLGTTLRNAKRCRCMHSARAGEPQVAGLHLNPMSIAPPLDERSSPGPRRATTTHQSRAFILRSLASPASRSIHPAQETSQHHQTHQSLAFILSRLGARSGSRDSSLAMASSTACLLMPTRLADCGQGARNFQWRLVDMEKVGRPASLASRCLAQGATQRSTAPSTLPPARPPTSAISPTSLSLRRLAWSSCT